jgi:hypothetical protein
MSLAVELIQTVEQAGGRFLLDGDRLGIVPATAAAPVMEELRQHKPEIIDLLSQRPAMPAGVRLVLWSPKAAPIQLEWGQTVTDTERFIEISLAQLAAALEGRNWQAGNWGLSGLLERLALCGCVVALDDPRKALQ